MEKIKLDLVPSGKMPSLHASQYDDGRDYHIDLTENRVPYVLDGTETISVIIRKCDNTLVTMDIANTFANKSYIEFEVVEQMTACSGFNYGEIILEKNGDRLGSLNFYLVVETAPDENGITSQSEVLNLNRQITEEVDRILPDMVDEVAEPIINEKVPEKVAELVPSAVSEVAEPIVREIAPQIVEDVVPSVIGDNYYNKTQTDEKFATNSAIKEPLNLADATITNNEINLLNCLYGYYVNYNTGSIERSNDYVATEYIAVEPQKRYVSFKTNHYAWYDENKAFISGSNTVVNELAPANAKYICLDFTRDNKDLAFFKIGYVAPFDKGYGISYPWLDNTNPIRPERFNQWGAYYANLFNKYTAIDGYYVKHDTGERATSSTYFLSDYIKVKPSTVYVMSRGNRYAVYDSDYQYITGANLNGTDIEFTTPANAAYMLVCNTPLSRKDEFVVAEKSVYSSIYESFGIVVPWIKPKVAKSKYDGKRLVCFGDSITFMGYTDTIKADTGIIAQNVGLSSGRYAYSDDSNVYINAFAFHHIVDSIVSGDWTIPDSINGVSGYTNQYQQIQAIKAIDFNTVDFVSIAYGTNDFSSATPLDNPNDEFDTNYFKGAIRYCLKKLTEAYPNLKIIGVTPCYRFWVSGGVVLYDSDEHDISGFYLSDYIEAIESVFSDFHLPIVNNYDNAGINKYNRLQYFNITDGLHPKLIGRQMLGHRIGAGILLNY